MISWTGFRSIGVPFIRRPRYRYGGEIKSSTLLQRGKNIGGFVVNSIVTFSDFPLKFITGVGVITSFLSFLLALYFLIGYLILGASAPGYVRGHTSLILVMLFLFGLLFVFLGIVGLYISRIYEEVKQRPLYVIRKKIGVR
jgi:dolichol-phosphate mannosyltransferase